MHVRSDTPEVLHVERRCNVLTYLQCVAAAFLSHQSKQTFQLDSDWKLMFRRFFYQFLLANERNVAKEIRDEYVDTMSKIYNSYFKSYSSRLLKVQVSPPRSSTNPDSHFMGPFRQTSSAKVNTFLQINRIN